MYVCWCAEINDNTTTLTFFVCRRRITAATCAALLFLLLYLLLLLSHDACETKLLPCHKRICWLAKKYAATIVLVVNTRATGIAWMTAVVCTMRYTSSPDTTVCISHSHSASLYSISGAIHCRRLHLKCHLFAFTFGIPVRFFSRCTNVHIYIHTYISMSSWRKAQGYHCR